MPRFEYGHPCGCAIEFDGNGRWQMAHCRHHTTTDRPNDWAYTLVGIAECARDEAAKQADRPLLPLSELHARLVLLSGHTVRTTLADGRSCVLRCWCRPRWIDNKDGAREVFTAIGTVVYDDGSSEHLAEEIL